MKRVYGLLCLVLCAAIAAWTVACGATINLAGLDGGVNGDDLDTNGDFDTNADTGTNGAGFDEDEGDFGTNGEFDTNG